MHVSVRSLYQRKKRLTSGADNVVDTQQQGRALDRRLERLNLDACALEQAISLHVGHLASLSINTVQILSRGVLCLRWVDRQRACLRERLRTLSSVRVLITLPPQF
jgi:hypothetical protein